MLRKVLAASIALPIILLALPTAAAAAPLPTRADNTAPVLRPAELMGLSGSYTTSNGSATITWQVTGARPVTKPKSTYSSASGIATPGSTVTITGTLTFVGVPRIPTDTCFSDVRQGVWLDGTYNNSPSFGNKKVGQTTASVPAGVPVTYPYTISIKIPKKIPANAAKLEKARKGHLGEVKGTFFSHACSQKCGSGFNPYDTGAELYMTIAILRK